MAIEIERKFLVAGTAWRDHATHAVPMVQGYLAGTDGKASVRVRLEGDAGKLNIKAAVVGMARAEYEYDIPAADARAILDTLCVGVLEKLQHYVPHAGHTWEVDEFAGANDGLVTAELELGDEQEAFERPDWLGEEVTHDRRYYNHALALQPYSTWPSR
jgi:adenylate cyclase